MGGVWGDAGEWKLGGYCYCLESQNKVVTVQEFEVVRLIKAESRFLDGFSVGCERISLNQG